MSEYLILNYVGCLKVEKREVCLSKMAFYLAQKHFR